MLKDFSHRMTVMSHEAFDIATTINLSAQQAAQALMESVQIRTFAELLRRFASGNELRSRLVDGLCANDPERSRESMDKKVRGWLSGKYQPTAREDLFELCFVLRMSVEEADDFLAAAGEEGLHWRDPHELVYAYALRKGMSYPEAWALWMRVAPAEEPGDRSGKTNSFTPLIRQEAVALETEEELGQYLSQAAGRLGRMHNSAYQQFTAMMQVLESPDGRSGREEGRYTTREIVEQYLDKKLPSLRQGKQLGEKHRSIFAGWPDEVTLSRMKNRKTDVTRKVLMLLFLATDGGEEPAENWQDEDDAWEDGEENEADLAFRSSYMRMNQMLAGCGYRMIDPRNPFDWIALYCMRVQDDATIMDGLNERLSHVLDVLFLSSRSEE